MPYLSRIWLNPLRAGAQQYLRSPQTTHAAILGGIARQPVTERVLWRLDPDPRTHHRLELLVLTQSRPSWESLIEQAGWPNAEEPQAAVRPFEPLLDHIVRGRQFAFRLKANPVRDSKHPDSPSPRHRQHLAKDRPRGVRLPHRTVAHQLDWFTKRIEQWGFSLATDETGLPALRIAARDRLTFRKRGQTDRSTTQVTLHTATYDGIVRINDPTAARESLLNGVGRGKAYGLGMITLAPPPLEPAQAEPQMLTTQPEHSRDPDG